MGLLWSLPPKGQQTALIAHAAQAARSSASALATSRLTRDADRPSSRASAVIVMPPSRWARRSAYSRVSS